MSYPLPVDIHKNSIPKKFSVWTAYGRQGKPLGYNEDLHTLLLTFPIGTLHTTNENALRIASSFPEIYPVFL